jgi:hypothetical protein|tara:strand:+ start:1050 stop:1412 length:363 start_codon:yes stop_codon:yes gene_type:complete
MLSVYSLNAVFALQGLTFNQGVGLTVAIAVSASTSWIAVLVGALIFRVMIRKGFGGLLCALLLACALSYLSFIIFGMFGGVPDNRFRVFLLGFTGHGIVSSALFWIFLKVKSPWLLQARQ